MPEAGVQRPRNRQVAVAHSRLLLAHNDNGDIVEAHITQPETCSAPSRRLLDFDQPVGLPPSPSATAPPEAEAAGLFARHPRRAGRQQDEVLCSERP
ncbi:SAM-dependent methyltransferase [Lentzea sp. CC55]|uniref:SAM-dependent methyltransferase n=1 Tax=Lentzea sp. CC55 TaxID=2884909 RepID=UPI001F3D7DB1|nr:SAM-dependent methyltransferase [Lentzea sp. CC55]MCG8927641.1 SAM-dependent methyltransferase [Lentzea sp. CC55]